MTEEIQRQVPRITIVSGFLGAGKTTLIKKMFKEGYLGKSPILLENDYGPLGVDGELAKSMGLQVSELVSGCICCTLKLEFPKALANLLQSGMSDQLVIEPSGISNLSDILSMLPCAKVDWEPGLTVCLVDCEMFWDGLEDFPAYLNQIIHSDVVVLGFLEEISDDELLRIMDAIYVHDPRKLILCADDKTDLLSLFARIPCQKQAAAKAAYEQERAAKKGKTAQGADEHHHHHYHSADSYMNYAKTLEGEWDSKSLQAALAALEQSERFGTILRAKGLVATKDGLLNANYVPGRAHVVALAQEEAARIEEDFESRIMVIGLDINKGALNELFIR